MESPPKRETLRGINNLAPEEVDSGSQSPGDVSPKLLVWSAADELGLGRLITTYSRHFRSRHTKNEGLDYLNNLAFTLNTRRTNLPWKSFVVIKSALDLERLDVVMSKPVKSLTSNPKLAFVFTGQGSQWFRMGYELRVYPTFLNSLLRSQSYLKTLGCEWCLMGISLIRVSNTRYGTNFTRGIG